jgi:hypothetical protein
MRTHHYSIAVHHYEDGLWSVSIVRTRIRRGVIVDHELILGPTWPSPGRLGDMLREYADLIESQSREGY